MLYFNFTGLLFLLVYWRPYKTCTTNSHWKGTEGLPSHMYWAGDTRILIDSPTHRQTFNYHVQWWWWWWCLNAFSF